MVDIKWLVDPSPDRTDATFYRRPDIGGDVAIVTHNGKSVYVSCDGETRFDFYDDDREYPDACFKYADELPEYGIFTDDDLNAVSSRGYWTFNSWFDVYTDEGEHVDLVNFDIYEAVDAAADWLTNAAHL